MQACVIFCVLSENISTITRKCVCRFFFDRRWACRFVYVSDRPLCGCLEVASVPEGFPWWGFHWLQRKDLCHCPPTPYWQNTRNLWLPHVPRKDFCSFNKMPCMPMLWDCWCNMYVLTSTLPVRGQVDSLAPVFPFFLRLSQAGRSEWWVRSASVQSACWCLSYFQSQECPLNRL